MIPLSRQSSPHYQNIYHADRPSRSCIPTLKNFWNRIWGKDGSIACSPVESPPAFHAPTVKISKPLATRHTNQIGSCANAVAVGFANASNNCWTNALLQMIKTVPAYEKAYRTIAEDAISAKNEKSFYGKILLNVLSKYEVSLAAKRSVSIAASQAVRGAFHHLIASDISMYATEQYDAYEALMHMMRCYAEILERKHTSLPSELFTSIVTERQYAPGQEVMTNKNYGKMADSLKTEEKQAEFHIILPLQANFDAHKRSCSFDQLLKQFFDNPRVQDSDPIIGKDAEGKTRKFHLLSEKQKFTSAPEQLTLVLNRTGMSRERGVYKIDVPVDVPHILTLSPEMTGDKETSIYKLACAILHSGPYGGGHYTMVKAVGNDWIELNDEKSTFVSENYISEMERKIFPSTGYVYHYVKENG